MLKNHLLTAWRNLKKNTVFSAINIIGLAIGLTVCILIMVYVEHESSYDKFHTNANRICWVQAKLRIGNDSIFIPALSFVSGPMVKDGDPSVESYLRFKNEGRNTVVQNPQSASLKFSEDKFLFADSNFFSFFSFKLMQGNKQTVLQAPFTIVISQKAAEKYFGKDNPVGKILRYNNKYNFTVTGVAEKVPSNSSIGFDFVASTSSLPAISEQQSQLTSKNVDAGSFTTYFLLRQPSAINHLEQQLAKLSEATGNDAFDRTAFIVTPLNLNTP